MRERIQGWTQHPGVDHHGMDRIGPDRLNVGTAHTRVVGTWHIGLHGALQLRRGARKQLRSGSAQVIRRLAHVRHAGVEIINHGEFAVVQNVERPTVGRSDCELDGLADGRRRRIHRLVADGHVQARRHFGRCGVTGTTSQNGVRRSNPHGIDQAPVGAGADVAVSRAQFTFDVQPDVDVGARLHIIECTAQLLLTSCDGGRTANAANGIPRRSWLDGHDNGGGFQMRQVDDAGQRVG
ncbi:hypothetical protein D3C81_1104200 [compost metagenome]